MKRAVLWIILILVALLILEKSCCNSPYKTDTKYDTVYVVKYVPRTDTVVKAKVIYRVRSIPYIAERDTNKDTLSIERQITDTFYTASIITQKQDTVTASYNTSDTTIHFSIRYSPLVEAVITKTVTQHHMKEPYICLGIGAGLGYDIYNKNIIPNINISLFYNIKSIW